MFFKIKKVLYYIIFFFFISTVLVTLLYKYIPPLLTPLMIIRTVEQTISSKKKIKLKKDWISLDNISQNLVQAIVASEDNLFQYHYGIDFKAIKDANRHNEKSKRLHGASTISQQTAKNVFLWPSRSWLRKGFEVYFTELIELIWGKERIMEVYLNVIEMGDGIYGVEAAAQTYFHKTAKNLTHSESAMIAAMLPAPRRWHPNRPSNRLIIRQQRTLINMEKIEKIEF